MIQALQPILYSYDPDQEGVWIDATPFRAHLALLLATGLTEPVIAKLAGISVRSVEHLAHGRRGRLVRRVCGDTGRRLLRITTMEARAIRFRPVPARPSRYRLRTMAAAGWTVQRLADGIGLNVAVVEQILDHGGSTCPQLAALKISVAYERWEAEQELPGTAAEQVLPAPPRREPVDARWIDHDPMTLATVLVLSAATGLAVFLATPAVLRRLPEPATVPEADAVDGADVKIPYATLATRRFAAGVGLLATVAVATAGLTLPAVLPGWLVLATLGLLLASIDAATTWLPLPLTRVAWATMVLATGIGAALGGWAQLLRGLGGFLIAGAVFGAVWLISRGGIGFGDVRFAPLVGAATAALSWSTLAWALVLGSVVGALVGLIRLAAGRRGSFAYAPSILAGAYLAAVVTWLTT